MASGGFAVSISVIDQTTHAVDKINARLEAMRRSFTKPFEEMKAPIEAMTKSLGKFSDLIGLSKMGRMVGALTSRFRGLVGVVSKVVGPLGALVAGGAIAAIWKTTAAWSDYGHQILLTAGYLGISTTQMQRYRQASRVAGLEPEAFGKGIAGLGGGFQEAVMNPGGAEEQLFKQFGIDPHSAKRFQARMANPEDFARISAGIQGQMQQGVSAQSIWQKLSMMGITDPQLQSVLMQGPDAVRTAFAKGELSPVQNGQQLKQAEIEAQKLAQFTNNIEQASNMIGQHLAPEVNLVVDEFNRLMEPTQKLTEGFTRLSETLGKGGEAGGSGTLLGGLGAGLEAGATGLSIGGFAGIPGVIGAAIMGVLGFGAHFENKATQDARERNRRQMGSGLGPTSMKTHDQTETQDQTLSPQMRGLLDTISDPESGGQYDVMFGGDHFTDFSKHPNIAHPITSGPYKGQTSTAAGRYQFLHGTFEDVANRYGLRDFSPESQDKAAAYLAAEVYRKKTGRDLNTDLQDPGKLAAITDALHGTWGSMPGGDQNPSSMSSFANRLARHSQQETMKGRAQVDINLNGFPKGTTATGNSYGELLGPPSVNFGMSSAFG